MKVSQASVVHALPSSVVTVVCVIAPENVSQASVVHALPSSVVTGLW